MKSTYKLFGVYWDGMKTMGNDELYIDSVVPKSSEFISFRKFLSIQNENDFDKIIAPYETNDDITIGIDYWIETSNPVLHAFLKKRLGQIVAHLSEKYQTVHCIKIKESPSGATNA